MDDRGRLRWAGAAATAAMLVGLLVGVAPGALADPTAPSDQDVRDAQAAVDDAQRSVAEMEIRLAELSTAADAADVQVQIAGESYTRALVAAQDAQDKADEAAERSAKADSEAETSRRELVAIARQIARSGGSADMIEALLSADGFQDVASRTSALDQFTAKTDDAVQRYRAAQLVASTLAEQSDTAAQDAKDAQTAAQDALAEAQQVADDADAARVAGEQERNGLLVALSQARQTSVDVERRRQDALDEERRRREQLDNQPSPDPTTPPSNPTTPPSNPTTPPSDPTTPPSNPTTPPSNPTTPPSDPTTPPTTPPVTPSPSPTPTKPPATPPYGLGTGRSVGSAQDGLEALSSAKSKIGAPYVWGGTGPGYDCSGLTMTSWSAAGVAINRTSRDQYKQVLKISYNDLRPGDLVFWSTDPSNPDSIYHVAMWAGNGQIVEAPRPGLTVRLTTMRWGGTMPYAGRP
ncbi:C40 family peptidase [Cellulomonas composti]|uniref:NlpC/P60 domain-containing protein n=1 Tax=Cellulomonas composti TaxID=266130 RepID=A0A511JBB1_9CELL|nr:C40 family peptidase [Cellulomonas composti]GEL95258.1 hypothetical protein CCO02nite_19160 [Cellulomonas composti]